MSASFTHHSDYSLINLVVDRRKVKSLTDAAVKAGANPVFIVNGRGILHKKKVAFITLPGISPSMDNITLAVPKNKADKVIQELVAVGHLNHFGAGAIYESRIQNIWFRGQAPFKDAAVKKSAEPVQRAVLQSDLVLINCICQRGHAEEIARGAMAAGSPSPTIRFGYGHGIRDKLNFLLQLAINPNKEIIQVVVGSAEADRVFEAMVVAGHLDHPAMGFISTHPVEKGLINMISYQNTSPYPATMEQIIKAIDKLEGSTNWRNSGTVQATRIKKRKMLLDLIDLVCIVKRGFGDACSIAAMEAGAGGTSISYANAYPTPAQAAHVHAGSDEREMISLTLGKAQVEKVVKAIGSMPELKDSPVLMYTYPTRQAVTYLK
ncbi:MAG: hypothetical protein JNM63_16730 [Spirochaetia bacterium]|nr:hypothetical protein [Spirochaetia bacterium]